MTDSGSSSPSRETAMPAIEEGGRPFRIILRSFSGLACALCVVLTFDVTHSHVVRAISGVLALGFGVVIALVGRPGWGYATAIGLFSLGLGAFGGYTCFADPACVPRQDAWAMLSAAVILIFTLCLGPMYPRLSAVRLVSRFVALSSFIVLLYLGASYRAFGGAILFLLIAVGSFVGLLPMWKNATDEVAIPAKAPPRNGYARGGFGAAVAGAMFWTAYCADDFLATLLVVLIGTVLLAAVVQDEYKARKTKVS